MFITRIVQEEKCTKQTSFSKPSPRSANQKNIKETCKAECFEVFLIFTDTYQNKKDHDYLATFLLTKLQFAGSILASQVFDTRLIYSLVDPMHVRRFFFPRVQGVFFSSNLNTVPSFDV